MPLYFVSVHFTHITCTNAETALQFGKDVMKSIMLWCR